MQATDTSDKVCKPFNFDLERGLECARRDYIDMTRIFDSIREMEDSHPKEYFSKFQALDGLCNVYDRLFSLYCKVFNVDVYPGGEDARSTGKPGWRECSLLHGLLCDAHQARECMKNRGIWRHMLRATGDYISKLPSKEIDSLSVEERVEYHHRDILPF